jgi:hypothetical protein
LRRINGTRAHPDRRFIPIPPASEQKSSISAENTLGNQKVFFLFLFAKFIFVDTKKSPPTASSWHLNPAFMHIFGVASISSFRELDLPNNTDRERATPPGEFKPFSPPLHRRALAKIDIQEPERSNIWRRRLKMREKLAQVISENYQVDTKRLRPVFFWVDRPEKSP